MFTGIVSAVGRVARVAREAGNGKREAGLALTIRAPYKGLKRGESMAINALPGEEVVQISVIPFTRAHTTLGRLAVGDRVHVEADVLGKYVRQLCRSER